mgnify:CR=1 FL=1
MSIKLIKLSEVLQQVPYSKSLIYVHIKQKLFPSQISLGARAVAFVYSEIQEVLKARITGKTDDEIRKLVISLEADRREI